VIVLYTVFANFASGPLPQAYRWTLYCYRRLLEIAKTLWFYGMNPLPIKMATVHESILNASAGLTRRSSAWQKSAHSAQPMMPPVYCVTLLPTRESRLRATMV
jgi:hypothetical protein